MNKPNETGRTSFRSRLVRAVGIICLFSLIAFGVFNTLCWTIWKRDLEYVALERDLEGYHLEEAMNRLRACFNWWPKDARFHLLAARAARLSQEYDQAEFHLEECARLSGSHDMAQLESALLEVQRGNLAAEEYLQKQVVENDSNRCFILEALAEGYRINCRYAKALYCLSLWVHDRPQLARAHFRRGEVNEKMLRRLEAIKDFRRALELDPNHHEARFHLATLLQTLGDLESALKHSQMLYAHRPHDPAVLVLLAQCLRPLGQLEDARQFINLGLSKSPSDTTLLMELGKMAMQEKNLALAEDCFRKVIKLEPYHFQANYSLYLCLVKLNKKDEAISYKKKAKKVEEDTQEFDKLLRKLLSRPANPFLRYRMGVLFLGQAQTAEALRWFHSALKEDPAHPLTHQALADYYKRQGNLTLADKHKRMGGLAPKKLERRLQSHGG